MIKLLIIIFSTVFARHIRRSVELYSMTGKHITISRTQIGSTWSTNSEYAQLDFVPVEKGYFVVRGFKTGKYIRASGRRLKLTDDSTKALVMKEVIMENYFNKYVTNNGQVLRLNKRGKLRLTSDRQNYSKSISFLSRKTHLKRHFESGQRL